MTLTVCNVEVDNYNRKGAWSKMSTLKQTNVVHSIQVGRMFLFVYLTWMMLTNIFIALAFGKFGLGGIATAAVTIPICVIIQVFLYKPLKKFYIIYCSSTLNKLTHNLVVILLCIIALTPIIYFGFMAYSPACGIPEMKRMVAEGTAYFEQHRDELYTKMETIPTDDDSNEKTWSSGWYIQSGQTFGGLFYNSNGVRVNTSSGYPMIYPLDEHWFLSFIEGYD